MKTKQALWAVLLLFVFTCLTPLACGSGDEEDGRGATLGDDDDDIMNPDDDDQGGQDDDDDDDDDDDWSEEVCDGDSEPHTIAYTTWDDLPASIKETLVIAFNYDQFQAKDFFGRFVYWYGVLRECSRSLRAYYQPAYPGSRWTEETTAASLAVSYLRFRGEGANIGYLHTEITTLYDELESPVPPLSTPQKYFQENRDEILSDPYQYLWYQIYWAKEALNADLLEFPSLLAMYVCDGIDLFADFPAQTPASGFEEPALAQTVFDTFDEELETWKIRLNPELTLEQNAGTGLITYE